MLLKQSQFFLKSRSFQGKILHYSFSVRSGAFSSLTISSLAISSLAIASSLSIGGTFALWAQTPSSMKRLPPPPLPRSNLYLSPPVPSSQPSHPSSVAPIVPTQVQSISPQRPPAPAPTSVLPEYTFQAPQSPPPRSPQSKTTSFKPAQRPTPTKPTQAKPTQAKPTPIQLTPTNSTQKKQPIASPSIANSRIPFYRVEIPGTDATLLAQVKSVEPLAVVWDQQGVIYGGIFPQQQLAQERVNQLQKKGVASKIVPLSRPK